MKKYEIVSFLDLKDEVLGSIDGVFS